MWDGQCHCSAQTTRRDTCESLNFLRLVFPTHSDIQFGFARTLMTDEHKSLQEAIRDTLDS